MPQPDEKALSIRELPSLVIPSFGTKKDGSPLIKQLLLPLACIKEAEGRLLETRSVNTTTYNDLEYVFNMAYMEMRNNFADIGLVLTRAESEMENIRAKIVLEKYPDFMKDKPRSADTPDARRSFIQLDEEYQKAQSYVGLLKAYEKLIEGRLKFTEKVTAYMKKQMDITIRSGSHNLYNTSGRK
jgi:hypothetical protein